MTIELTVQDMQDYRIGSAILACGQSEDDMLGEGAMVKAMSEEGLKVRLASPEEIPDDKFISQVQTQGGGGVPQEVAERLIPYFKTLEKKDWGVVIGDSIKKAVREMADFAGKESYGYVASCTSPLQGIVAMYAAALDGKVCVDGDCCGRARPAYPNVCLTVVAGLPHTPFVMVNLFGETVIIKSAVDADRAGDIRKFVHVVSGGKLTAVATFPISMKDYRGAIVPNYTSRCIKIGKAIRKARKEKRNPIEAFIKTSRAYKLFEGKVTSYKREETLGYVYGEWMIEGTGKFAGHTFKVWHKNENLISWLDNQPYVTCPDLICIVESKTCKGLTHFGKIPDYVGEEVTVFGLPAYELWRTKKGIDTWNPKRYGFDIDYKPLEEVVREH